MVNLACIVAAVLVLWKAADWFVDGAVGLAERLGAPKMLVGIVLVSFCTTAPEFMSSFIATLQGQPVIALGNAIGSITVDVGVALALAALLASTPLQADPLIFRTSGVFVLLALGLGFALCMDGTLGRLDGAVLLAAYVAYVTVAYRQYARRQRNPDVRERMAALAEHEQAVASMSLPKIVGLFAGGIAGVLVGAELLIHGAVGVAAAFGLSPEVIGLTVVAIGTSVPEIVTCVASALKRQSQIGVGNIIGADILNICWVAGASAVANPLTAGINVIWFMFPAALVLVGAMVLLLRMGYNLTRWNGAALLALYAGYMALLLLGVGR